MEILNKGEFQVSDKEREGQLENLRLDIANIIVKMTVNSQDGN
jgi:ribosome maturation protein Sdo1